MAIVTLNRYIYIYMYIYIENLVTWEYEVNVIYTILETLFHVLFWSLYWL